MDAHGATALRSWCTWHKSDGTCISHRPCACGRPPVLQTRDNRDYCIEHAVWNGTEHVWEAPLAVRITIIETTYTVEGIDDRTFHEGITTHEATENHVIHGTTPQTVRLWGDQRESRLITRQEAFATRARWEREGRTINTIVNRCLCCTEKGLE